jgi:hypothetical protein
MRARRRSLGRLTDLLGEAHDLALLHDWVRHAVESRAVARVEPQALRAIDRPRRGIERRTLPLGRRLFADRPAALADRIATFWEAWRVEREEARPAGAGPSREDERRMRR